MNEIEKVLIRTYSAGVHYGELVKEEKYQAALLKIAEVAQLTKQVEKDDENNAVVEAEQKEAQAVLQQKDASQTKLTTSVTDVGSPSVGGSAAATGN